MEFKKLKITTSLSLLLVFMTGCSESMSISAKDIFLPKKENKKSSFSPNFSHTLYNWCSPAHLRLCAEILRVWYEKRLCCSHCTEGNFLTESRTKLVHANGVSLITANMYH